MADIVDCKALGELIRQERKQQNVTQVELAALAGVGVRFIRELEGGKPSCQLGLALTVVTTLGISITALPRSQ